MKTDARFGPELTVRAILVGAAGSVVIAASSTYVALRMGALPWPTVFVAVLSMAMLKPFGAGLREINTAHTGMSAGGLVAGGLAFTLPGLWMSDPGFHLSLWTAIWAAVAGALLGSICTGLVRKYFIEERDLPFPMGVAAARTLQAGDRGGKRAAVLFSACGFAGLFTFLRDGLGKIPAVLGTGPLFSFWLSPMALGIGFIIGPLYMGSWLAGGLAGHWLLVPVGLSTGFFGDAAAAAAFRSSLGIGLIVGSGLAVLFKGALPALRRTVGLARPILPLLGLGAAASVAVLTFFVGIPLVPSLLATVGVWVTVVMAATLTGQTGIDPMEIFGILVLLSIRLVVHLEGADAFLVAAVVAVATGLAGDVLQDFRAGAILGTNPSAQWINETVGGITGAVAAACTLFLLKEAFGAMGPGTDLMAPQAFAVKSMVEGLPHPWAFVAGLAVGLSLTLKGAPGMTVGIGMYLPLVISLTAGAGGLAALLVGKRRPLWEEKGVLIASGLLGGEGITGVLLALWKVVTLG